MVTVPRETSVEAPLFAERVLDRSDLRRKDSGSVSDAPSDLVSRGRAIFERLRAPTSLRRKSRVRKDRKKTAASTPASRSIPTRSRIRRRRWKPQSAEPAPTEDPPAAPAATAEPDERVPHDFRRPLPRTIAVTNQKGGVGKTTTAVNLGAATADLGYRVLVVDLDPQGNATTGLGLNTRDLQSSMYDVILHDAPIEDCIEATSVRNLFVAPASLDLAGAEIELVPAFSRELQAPTRPRRGPRRLRLHLHRLPAVARSPDRERARRGHRGAGARSSASTTPSRVWGSSSATSRSCRRTSTRRSS